MGKNIVMIGDCHAVGWQIIVPKIFGKQNNYHFYYQGGNGNQWMSGILFEHLEIYGKPDYVYIMFSNLTKLDFAVNDKVNIPNYPWQSKFLKRKYIQSGGGMVDYPWGPASWTDNSLASNIFKYFYDLKNPSATHDYSWKAVFMCIELCRNQNIDLQWNFFYDLENPPNKNLEKWFGESKYPQWIDRKDQLPVHQLNYAYEIGLVPKDENHYSVKVNEAFFRDNKKLFRI